MTAITAVTLEVDDPTAADAFYAAAFGLGGRVRVRASDAPTSGFRGFTLSLVVSQPGNVDALMGAAVEGGATLVKPAKKSLWGYGGAVQAPDGTVWTVASSAKKDSGPATREVDNVVLLLGVEDVKASKRFYVERGLSVAKGFLNRYVEFEGSPEGITLAIQPRRANAKNAGVASEGSGSHRIVIGGDAGAFTDPDGFAWETAAV